MRSSCDDFLYVTHRATYPHDLMALRDEGLCLWALKRYGECADCFERFIKTAPRGLDTKEVSPGYDFL